MFGFGAPLTFLIIVIALIISGIKILKEYERAVVFRLGRMVGARGPGITYIIPGVEKMVKMDLRTVTMDIPPQDVITRDNVSVKVNAVLYFRVLDPNRAVVEVENYLFATSQLAQVTLRSVCGQAELDELLAERERINSRIQEILDQQTDPWGIKVVLVELKYIDLPQEMQRAMAKQAEAERERRAKVIHAGRGEGVGNEKQAYVVESRPLMTGEYIQDARVRPAQQLQGASVELILNAAGARLFEQITAANVKRRLAIVLDNRVYSAPVIQERIGGGRASITGNFDLKEARDLSIVLRAGALPAPVEILEERTVGPSLGSDSIRDGVISFVVGSTLVIVFM